MGPKKATKAAVLKKMKVVKGQQQFSAPLSIRCQVMPSGRVGRPKRDKVPARFNLVPEAIGLSWAEEADLNRALYASIKGKKRRKRAAAAQCRSCPRKDSTSGSATSGSADYGAAASHEPSKATKRRSASCGSPVTKRPHAQRKFAQGGASPDIDFYGQQVSPSPRLQQQQGAARKATSGNLTLTPVFADENGPTIYTEDLVKYLCYRNSPANMNFRSMAPFVNSASYRKTAPAAPANGTRSMSLSCEPHGGNMQQCSGKANQKNGSSFVSAVLLHDVAQVLPEADRDDPLGSYIYAKLLGSDLSERFVSSHDSHTFTLQEVRDYARTELKYRAELRSKSVRVDELQPPKRGKRSNTAPPVPPLPPYTCSVTKYNCHLSVVFAAGDLISTRYAALLASGLTRDPTACLYTLVTDDLLQSLCKEGNKH